MERGGLFWKGAILNGKSLTVQTVCTFQLKMQTVNFILIKNLCIVDLIGALVILPVPLVATARGRFDFGDAWCTANSIINVALWFQHIVMFAMLKVLCSKIKRFEHFFFH